MRLYRILGAGWAGTQVDAKAKAKDAGAPFHEYDVPTDKAGLLAFLEARNVPASEEERPQLEQLREPLERDPMNAAPPAPAEPSRQDNYTAGAIVEFILDRASVAQVENIMQAIGTRFAELAKENR